MTTVAEATIDEPPILEDSALAVLCTAPQQSALLPRLPIRAFFPITADRTLNERLTARRTIIIRGIHYTYTFLTSPTVGKRSSNAPLRTYSAPSRLERASSMPSSPSLLPKKTITSSLQQLSPISDTHPSSSASISQQEQPNTDKYIAHTEQVNSDQYTLQDKSEQCTAEKNTVHPQVDNSEPYLPQKDSERHAENKNIVQLQEDHSEIDLLKNNTFYANNSSSIDPCPIDTSNPEDYIDEVQPCLEEGPSIPLVAEPTINLSTPPSRSISSSRLPIRTSKSMPTQYTLNDSPISAKTSKLPAAGLPRTPIPPRAQSIHANLRTPNRPSSPRPSSPRPSSVPIRKTMTSQRPVSKVPMMATTRVARTLEADVPMPRKAIYAPTSAGAGQESNDTDKNKVQEEEEEEETTPVRLTAQEKRRREAMRAQQVKLWRVREEREAREARTVARRRLMERRREPSPPPPAPRRAVKFNLKRNKIIEISQQESQ